MGTYRDVVRKFHEFSIANRPALENELGRCREQIRYWQSRSKTIESALAATDEMQNEPPPPPTAIVRSYHEIILAMFAKNPDAELKIGEIAERAGVPLPQCRAAIGGLSRKNALQALGHGLYRLPSDGPPKRRPAAA